MLPQVVEPTFPAQQKRKDNARLHFSTTHQREQDSAFWSSAYPTSALPCRSTVLQQRPEATISLPYEWSSQENVNDSKRSGEKKIL